MEIILNKEFFITPIAKTLINIFNLLQEAAIRHGHTYQDSIQTFTLPQYQSKKVREIQESL